MSNFLERINKLLLPVTIIISTLILGGFYYFSQVNQWQLIKTNNDDSLTVEHLVNQVEKVDSSENKDHFNKKIDCEKYKDSIKKEIQIYNNLQRPFIGDSAVPANPDNPEIPRLYLYNREFIEVFYSPQINSCLYYEISRTFIASPEEKDSLNINWGVSFESHSLIDYLEDSIIEIDYSIYRSEGRGSPFDIAEKFNSYK